MVMVACGTGACVLYNCAQALEAAAPTAAARNAPQTRNREPA
jgi:hypothetical protein